MKTALGGSPYTECACDKDNASIGRFANARVVGGGSRKVRG